MFFFPKPRQLLVVVLQHEMLLIAAKTSGHTSGSKGAAAGSTASAGAATAEAAGAILATA